MAYTPQGNYENIGQVNSNGRGQRVIGQEYMPTDEEKRLGIDQMMASESNRDWANSGAANAWRPSFYNAGRSWTDQNSDPVGLINPGTGELGQSARSMYGLDPQGLADNAQREAQMRQQWQLAQAMQSPQVMQSIQTAALGQAPSQAESLLNNSMGQAMRNQMLMAGAAKGGAGQRFGAMQSAQQNMGQMQSSLSSQLAALRAQEMAQARGQYLQQAGLGQQREFGYLGAGNELYQNELARKMRLGEKAADLAMGKQGLEANIDMQKRGQNLGILGGVLGGAAGGAASGLTKWALT